MWKEVKKESESLHHQINGLILTLEQRKARFEKMSEKVRRMEEYKCLCKILLHHTCSINMLNAIKELIGLGDVEENKK